MNCPRCDETELLQLTRGGIEVDVCPSCRGTWLDRGELQQLVGGSERQSKKRGLLASLRNVLG
jgi:Zn-finger nucleic acid-binding protein